MLNNLQQMDRHDYSGQFFLGTVVANNDPDRMERIKVRIPNLYDATVDLLPWVAPMRFGIIPNKPNQHGSFGGVPTVDSLVFVILQEGNPQYPFYVGSPQRKLGQIPEADINYPNRYGFKDPAGNLVYIDATPGQNNLRVQHASGSQITIDNDGNIWVLSAQDLTLQALRDVHVLAGRDINATATGDTTIIGQQVHLNP